MKPEPLVYGDRKVYTVAAFNRGVASWLERLPTLWVEGEVTELRRQPGWQSVFFTLKDPGDGACLGVTMPRAGATADRRIRRAPSKGSRPRWTIRDLGPWGR